MGKLGRFGCVIVPILLTLASLVCLFMVVLAGTNRSFTGLNKFYFLRADTTKFNPSPSTDLVKGTDVDNQILDRLFGSGSKLDLKDFYNVYLWNTCRGTIADGVSKFDECSKPVGRYYFNPITEWGLEDQKDVKGAIPQNLRAAIRTYERLARWIFIFYVVAIIATAVEFLLGFFAIMSRWGSFVTTIVAGVAALSTLVASGLVSGVYGTLVGGLNSILRPYGIEGSLGRQMFVTTWTAVLFSWAAALFWLFSVCCCSGRSNNPKSKVQPPPYNYERVGTPYAGAAGAHPPAASHVPMYNLPAKTNAYEPYRHNVV